MAGCKLTSSLGAQACNYNVAGVRALYLTNYYPVNTSGTPDDNTISYTMDPDGVITDIKLPTGEKLYKIDATNNSISWQDALVVSSNGNKHRTHTVNAVVGQYDTALMSEVDALSLGTFVAIVVDTTGRCVVLGRTNGLQAKTFNYDSGKAEADANGWTAQFERASKEVGPLLKDESVITPVDVVTITP